MDAHDDEERAAIAAILEELPVDHHAREAHRAGADAIALTHLVGRRDLSERLTAAWLAGYNRLMRRAEHFRPWPTGQTDKK